MFVEGTFFPTNWNESRFELPGSSFLSERSEKMLSETLRPVVPFYFGDTCQFDQCFNCLGSRLGSS